MHRQLEVRFSRLTRRVTSAIVLSLGLMVPASAQAQLTWDNGGPNNNWSTADANWLPGNVVWSTGDAIFGATPETVTPTTTNVVDNITFGASWTIADGSAASIDLTTDGNSDITVNPTFTSSIAEVLSGTNTVTKLGTGTLTLTGANSYTGATQVSNGTLVFANKAAKSAGSAVSTTAATGTVGLGVKTSDAAYYSAADVAALFNTNSLSGFTLTTGGTLATNSGVAIDTTNAGGSFDQTTALTAARALTKLGTGTLILSQANTYTGPTTISGGTLQIGGSGSLGSGATYLGAISIASGATFQFSSSYLPGQIISGAITGPGGITKDTNASSALFLDGANTYSGTSTLSAGFLNGTTNSASLTPLSPFGTSALQLNGGTLQVRALGTANATAETIEFNNNVTVGGNTTINSNRSGGGTGSNKTIQLGTLSIGAQTLRAERGGNAFFLRFQGATTLTGNATFNVTGTNAATALASVLTLNGAVGDGGSGYSLTKDGTGTLILLGANTYSGGTTLNQGTLTVGTGGTLGATTGALTVSNTNSTAVGTASVLNLATAVDTTTGSLSGTIATPTSGTNTATINNGGVGRNFTVNQTAPGTYAGVIAGAGSFTLGSLSTNKLTLTGANTYTGATNVNAGTLLINGSTVAGSAVTVSNSATLGGTGTIGGAVAVNDSAVIAPGTSPGGLVLGSTFNLTSLATMAVELEGINFTLNGLEQYDRLKVTGASTLSGLLSVSLTSGWTLGANQFYGILDAVGGRSGLFSNYSEGATVLTNSGYFLKITYNGLVADSGTPSITGGSDVVLYTVAVPEPSSLAMLAFGSVFLWFVKGRRHK